MDGSRRPRHIRDIAHLYLSRRVGAAGGGRRKRIYIATESRECFGAYHAANLALGFAHKGFDVELIEVSGVIPCSGYFLRLPPRVYLKHKQQSPQEPLSALGGVRIRFAAPERAAPGDNTAAGVSVGAHGRTKGLLELVHLPPANGAHSTENRPGIAAGVRDNGTSPVAGAVVIALDAAGALTSGREVFGNDGAVEWATLSLDGGRTSRPADHGGRRSLGYLSGWRALLADPLPCVIRDPGSHVSRSYLAVCDALLIMGSMSRGRDENTATGRTASLGPLR